MTKSLGEVAGDLREYFEMKSQNLKLKLGRFINPVYVVNPVPETFEEADSQAAPVQNTYYEVLSEQNVIVWDLSICVDTTGETLAWYCVVDDFTSVESGGAAAAGATRYCLFNADVTNLRTYSYHTDSASFNSYKGFPLLMGRSVKIYVRKTTAAGAGTLKWVCKYSKY
jgi:hypothetical protein